MNYQDRYYFFFGVVIVTLLSTLIGTDHTLEELLHDPIVPKKLLYNSITIAGAWWIIRRIIQQFDRKIPWKKTPAHHRWPLQLLACWSFVLLFFIWDINFRTLVIPDWKFYPKTVWATDLPLSLTLCVFINFVYYYLWSQQETSVASSINTANNPPDTSTQQLTSFSVRKGKETHLVSEKEIAYIFRRNEINYLATLTGQRFLLDGSINQFETEIQSNLFFRLNRQLLAQRAAIQSFQTLPNRQLEVILEPQLEGKTTVNKNKAAAFKRWLAKSNAHLSAS